MDCAGSIAASLQVTYYEQRRAAIRGSLGLEIEEAGEEAVQEARGAELAGDAPAALLLPGAHKVVLHSNVWACMSQGTLQPSVQPAGVCHR